MALPTPAPVLEALRNAVIASINKLPPSLSNFARASAAGEPGILDRVSPPSPNASFNPGLARISEIRFCIARLVLTTYSTEDCVCGLASIRTACCFGGILGSEISGTSLSVIVRDTSVIGTRTFEASETSALVGLASAGIGVTVVGAAAGWETCGSTCGAMFTGGGAVKNSLRPRGTGTSLPDSNLNFSVSIFSELIFSSFGALLNLSTSVFWS